MDAGHVFSRHDWRYQSCWPESESRALLDALATPGEREILKDDRNSRVERVAVAGRRLIVKIPVARNKRLWERLTTRFRPGKARRAWLGMLTLKAAGFHVPEPVLIGERRRAGCVVDSFMVYEFAEGQPLQPADLPAVEQILRNLHAIGYLRHDASAHNYLKQGDRIIMIDTTLRRPRVFRKSRFLLERLALYRATPQAWFAASAGDASPVYLKALYRYRTSRDAWRQARRTLRQWLRRPFAG